MIRKTIKTKELTPKEMEFLAHSNWIEKEYSDEAMEGAIKAWEWAKEHKDNIHIWSITTIHSKLMKRLNRRIAGHIRNCPVYVGGKCRSQSRQEIESNLNMWAGIDFKSVTEKGIKRAHVRFENIHPFEDGNGRTGRILMNIQRLNAKLPILIIKEEEKSKYYKWFK